MRTTLFFAIVFSFMLSGCTKDITTDEMVDLKKASVPVPAKCSFTTTPDFTLGATLCTPTEMGVAICGGGWMSGHQSHGGKLVTEKSTYRVVNCEFDYMTLQASENIEGSHMVANGDSYHYTGLLNIDVTNGRIWGTVTVTNGTGIFSGATAELTLSGVHNLTTDIATFTCEGFWHFDR